MIVFGTVNPLLSPLSNKPPPLPWPFLFRGRKLISPSFLPDPGWLFIHQVEDVFDSRLHDLQLLVLELFHFAF